MRRCFPSTPVTLYASQEKEHAHTFDFHAAIASALSTLQFAKLILYSNSFGVKPWLLLQYLAVQKAASQGPAVAAATALENSAVLDDWAHAAMLLGEPLARQRSMHMKTIAWLQCFLVC